MGMTAVQCSDCGYDFQDFDAALFPTDPLPCPECGASERHAYLELLDFAAARESTRLVGRPSEGGKPFLQARHAKLSWFQESQRWHVVTRVINRLDDQYDEVITDAETGEIVREVHEPLSQHRGRGSARQREGT
jgi:hypothetical protein